MKITILFLLLISLFTFTFEKKTCQQKFEKCNKRCVKQGGAQKNMCFGICKGTLDLCKKKNK